MNTPSCKLIPLFLLCNNSVRISSIFFWRCGKNGLIGAQTPLQRTTSHTVNHLRVFTLLTLHPKLDNSSSCLTPGIELGMASPLAVKLINPEALVYLGTPCLSLTHCLASNHRIFMGRSLCNAVEQQGKPME